MSLSRKLTSSYTVWSGVTEDDPGFFELDPGKYASSIRPQLELNQYVNLQEKVNIIKGCIFFYACMPDPLMAGAN